MADKLAAVRKRKRNTMTRRWSRNLRDRCLRYLVHGLRFSLETAQERSEPISSRLLGVGINYKPLTACPGCYPWQTRGYGGESCNNTQIQSSRGKESRMLFMFKFYDTIIRNTKSYHGLGT